MEEVAQTGQLCGVADLMRWEILLKEGGIAIDVDSVCLNSLPQWLLACELFACWDNEIHKPGLIANGIVGAKPQNLLIRYLVNHFSKQKTIATRFSWKKMKRKPVAAWKATGPLPFTQALSETKYTDFTILPSHFFNPIHYSGYAYKGNGPVYCTQLFAGTEGSKYEQLYKSSSDELINHVKSQLRQA
jgi:mannosyltransferase OCH1-like enzyme